MNQMLHPVPDRNHRGDSSRTMDGNDTAWKPSRKMREKKRKRQNHVLPVCSVLQEYVWQ